MVDSGKLQGTSISILLQRFFQEISRVSKESLEGVSSSHGLSVKLHRYILIMFQECFKQVLFDDFVIAWQLLQLPEQKECFTSFGCFKEPKV